MNLKTPEGNDAWVSTEDMVPIQCWEGLEKMDPYLHNMMRKFEADGCTIYVIPVTPEQQAMCLSIRQKIAAVKGEIIICAANIRPNRTPSEMVDPDKWQHVRGII